MPFSIIPFALLIVPILEIVVFIAVGDKIGYLSTIALVLITAIIGSILLRWQGFQVLSKLQSESAAGHVPGKEMVHGAMILVAGVLLLTPGFITDTIGFLLFVPGIRDVIWSWLSSKIKIIGGGGFSGPSGNQSPFGRSKDDENIVDLDPDDFSDIGNENSPWGENHDKNNRLDKD